MAKKRVVILSDQSLFAEGVASRLQQYPEQVEVRVLNPTRQECLEEIAKLSPAVVILDTTNAKTLDHCPLNKLLHVLPELKVIELDTQQKQVQVVTSKQHKAVDVRDLIEVIQ